MILPPRTASLSARRPLRAQAHRPDWPSVAAGAGVFLLAAAACLYVLARLAI